MTLSSKFAQSEPPSASPNLLDHSLQVYLQTRCIPASECIFKFTWSRCGERVEPAARQPIMNTPPHFAIYPKEFVRQSGSSSRSLGTEWDDVYLPWSLPTIYCLLLSPSPLSLYHRMYIYRETSIIHAILWHSESCDCNKDQYDRWNTLWLWNPKNHCCVRIWHQVSRRDCAEVSAALEVSRRPAQRSQQLQNLTILIVNLVASWMHLYYYRCFQEHVRMLL